MFFPWDLAADRIRAHTWWKGQRGGDCSTCSCSADHQVFALDLQVKFQRWATEMSKHSPLTVRAPADGRGCKRQDGRESIYWVQTPHLPNACWACLPHSPCIPPSHPQICGHSLQTGTEKTSFYCTTVKALLSALHERPDLHLWEMEINGARMWTRLHFCAA